MDNLNANLADFLERLISASPIIANAHERSIKYWSPDEVPETIALYDIGNAFVDDFASLSSNEINEIAKIIEEGVTSNVYELRNAVIVGLVDAIASAAVNTNGKEHDIFERLLGTTRSYALQWSKDS